MLSRSDDETYRPNDIIHREIGLLSCADDIFISRESNNHIEGMK